MNDHNSGNWLTERAHAAMLENGFEPEFSAAVIEQVNAVRAKGGALPQPSIRDMRSTLWSSIDNARSRDLDQIEWAEMLPNGDIRVLVGIADVDAAVEKGSPIDRHAAQNTVTVYTESKIFPMMDASATRRVTACFLQASDEYRLW